MKAMHLVALKLLGTIFLASLLISNQASAVPIESSAELLYLGTYSNNPKNPRGIDTLSEIFGLPANLELADTVIGRGSSSGPDNGFSVTPTNRSMHSSVRRWTTLFSVEPSNAKGKNKAPAKQAQDINGEWWFEPDQSSFNTIDYIVVKAANQYAVYEVNYANSANAGGSVHGQWSNANLGNSNAMPHLTAYSVPTLQTPLPAAAWFFGSALAGLLTLGRGKKKLS
jgi:hypothetical protein